MMTSARIAGLRAYGVRGANATRRRRGAIEVPAVWPGIVAPEELAAIRAVVADRSGRLAAKGARRYLLSGFLVCACGAKMGTRPPSSGGAAGYVCRADRGGCGSCGVNGPLAEAEVVARVLLAMALHPVPGDGEALEADRQRLEVELAEVEHRYHGEGSISRLDYWAEMDRLRRLLEDVAVRAAAASRPVPGMDDPGGGVGRCSTSRAGAACWPPTCGRVVVAPVGKGGHVWRPERLTVEWLA
jgi:hypothetical protein